MFRKDAEAVGFHRLAEKAAPLIPPEVLIVAVDDHSPLLMYQLNRKGWHCGAVQCTPAFLNAVRARGAQYLVGHHRSFAESSRSDWLKDFLASPSREVPLDDGQDFVGRL
jgi:hypothetical protein